MDVESDMPNKPETDLIMIGLPTGEVIHAAAIRGVEVLASIGGQPWRVLVHRYTAPAILDCSGESHADQVARELTNAWRSGLREYALMQALGDAA